MTDRIPVFRRQALDRGAIRAGATKLVTGHNADDLAETVVMNFLRGDINRLQRGAAHVSPGEEGNSLPRVKPLKYSYEKDIVMYAHFKRLNYFSTECIYSPNSYRGNARNYVKSLERERPKAILDLIHSAETLRVSGERANKPTLASCQKCGYISSQQFCKACLLLYGLNSNNYTIGVSGKVSSNANPPHCTQCDALDTFRSATCPSHSRTARGARRPLRMGAEEGAGARGVRRLKYE